MTLYAFEQFAAIDRDATRASLAQFDAFAPSDSTYSTPLPIFDMGGIPMSAVEANTDGVVQPYQVEGYLYVNLKSGDFIFPRVSAQGLVDEVAAGSAAAEQALADLAQYIADNPGQLPTAGKAPGKTIIVAADGTTFTYVDPVAAATASWSTLSGKPATFPPDAHTTSIDDLRKATGALSTPVLSLLQAVDATGLRAVVQAAPATTVSFPGFGRTNLLAMRGDAVLGANEITTTAISGIVGSNVQAVLAELKGLIGTGGGGGTAPSGTRIVIRYNTTTGTWPLRPTTGPTGAVYDWVGPISVAAPTTGGGYMLANVDFYMGIDG